MKEFYNIIENLQKQIPPGVNKQLKEYLGKYSQDSNSLMWLVIGLVILYFVIKMLMPMVQSVIVIAVVALIGWFVYKKWTEGGSG